jgi:uncharacterized OB-fold protein
MATINVIEKVAGNELYGAAFRRALQQKKLTAAKCQQCGAMFLPPRPICPVCQGEIMAIMAVAGKGKLVAFTVITTPPPLMAEEGYSRDKPYCSGVIELEEGVKVAARVLGVDTKHPENIKIGTPMAIEFQETLHNGEKRIYLAFRVKS